MCGIAGILDADASLESLESVAVAMGRCLVHRGPDDEGLWSDPRVGLAFAHRRLAVLDLTQHGHQPMMSADGRYVLVFNGEIYNYRELERRLAGRGIRLRGHSDTEALLETIARESIDAALQAANGMFALALWDRKDATLTLARDRLGEKPLYYAWMGQAFVFASELNALRSHGAFSRRLDPRALALFVRHSYVPGPETIFDGVFKLPPGHTLSVRTDHAVTSAEPQPYWTLREVAEFGRGNPLEGSVDDLVELADSLLRDSVRARMLSDVPLGAFLSGGIDSSLIVATMQEVSSRPVRTFTVSVGGQYDESLHAAAVAAYLGTDHTQITLEENEALSLASQVPAMYDEPFADPSAIPTAMVSAAARRHVTVCLTGDGGDEVMAGYNRYLVAESQLRRLMALPLGLRKAIARATLKFSPSLWDRAGMLIPPTKRIPGLGTKVHKMSLLLADSDSRAAYRTLTTILDPALVLHHSAEWPTPATQAGSWLESLDPLHWMLYLDGVMTLPDNMLVKVDRASMAASLECRVPLLDHRFVELAWRLPYDVKLRDGRGKWLLRQMLRRRIPEHLFSRPKQGFDPPIAAWLRGPLRPWLGDLLSTARLRRQGIFDADVVSRLVNEHMTGVRNHDYPLWTLVVFQSWMDQHSYVPALSHRPTCFG